MAGVGLFLFSLRSVVFAYALDVAPGEMGASTVGVLFGAQQVVTAFSPLLVGVFADWMGLGAAVLLAAAFSLLGGVVVIFLPLLARETTPTATVGAASS